MYLFGGANAAGPKNDLFTLNLENMEWEEINNVPEAIKPREMHSMELTD